jgi:hypothetical protein
MPANPTGQRPDQSGGRFSRKAVTPSLMSSLAVTRSTASAVTSQPVA